MYIQFTDDTETADHEKFVATHEWQVVKKGQSIPKGLHIRYDLQTGVYMAKLLVNEETEDTTTQAADIGGQLSPKTDILTGENIYKRLTFSSPDISIIKLVF